AHRDVEDVGSGNPTWRAAVDRKDSRLRVDAERRDASPLGRDGENGRERHALGGDRARVHGAGPGDEDPWSAARFDAEESETVPVRKEIREIAVHPLAGELTDLARPGREELDHRAVRVRGRDPPPVGR